MAVIRQFRTADLALAVFGLGCLITLVLNWPGHVGYDAIVQLREGRTGIYENWHPAVMSWLLGIFDAVVPGAGLFVVFNTVLLFASFAAIAVIARPPVSRLSIAFAIFCILTPQLLVYPAIVWKDVLFAGLAIGAFAGIALADRFWDQAPIRFATIGTTLMFAALAALTRQNGVIVLIIASVALGFVVAGHGPTLRLRNIAAYAALAAVVAGALTLSGLALLSTRMSGTSGTSVQVRLLQVYDVAGAIAEDPAIPLDDVHQFDPAAERAMRAEAPRFYTPQSNDPLTERPVFAQQVDHPTSPMIAHQWLHLVSGHPLLYLAIRARVFRETFAPDEICVPAELGISTDLPDETKTLGIAPRYDSRDRAIDTYITALARTPVLSHVTYFLLAVSALAFLLWRRTPSDLVVAAMLISALAFVASFFFISIACDYRYLLFLDLAALVGGFHVALTFRQARAPGGVHGA